MAIRVLSLDFDGCLFHDGYIDSQVKDVIAANKAFFQSLKLDSAKYTKSLVFVGSNRQSFTIDMFNGMDSNKGSCYPAIKKIAEELNAELDPFLLADIYGDLDYGVSYHRAIHNEERAEHADWVFDETKATILYAQIHKVANQYPNETIFFDFYDDRGINSEDDILEWLFNFYNQYPDLIPANVSMRLHHYAGAKVADIMPYIIGTGFIDKNYRLTVKAMAQVALAAQKDDEDFQQRIYAAHHVKPELLSERLALEAVGTRQSAVTEVKASEPKLIIDPEHAATFNFLLKKMHSKVKELKLRQDFKAAIAAEEVHNKLTTLFEQFKQHPEAYEAFRQESLAAIDLAHEELDKHRGWTELLVNLACCISVLGIFVKGAWNWYHDKPFFFVSKTKSEKLMDDMQEIIENISPIDPP